MKRRLIISVSILLFAMLFFPGCQKEISDEPAITSESDLESRGRDGGDKNGCRVTAFDYYDGITDVHQIDYYSYKRGLVDEWAVWYGYVYKIEYHGSGKLKKSRVYESGILLYTIHFFYKNDKVVKEIWYAGDTKDVYDEVIYTFDRKGQIIRAESFVLDYFIDNTYSANGNLLSWKFYGGGSPVVSGHYTYRNHYKSPLFEGTPGVNYNFPYSNSTFGRTKWWYSSEKIVYYDENGNPSVYYDQDPRQTTWHIGNNNYPELVEYVSPVTGSQHSVGFEYANCERGNNGYHRPNESARKNPAVSTAQSNSIRSIISGPRDKLKQKIDEFRQEMKKRSKN